MHNSETESWGDLRAPVARGMPPHKPDGRTYRTTVVVSWAQRDFCQAHHISISALLRAAIAARMESGGRAKLQRELEEAEDRARMLRLALAGIAEKEAYKEDAHKAEADWQASAGEFADKFWSAEVQLPGGLRGRRDGLTQRENLNYAGGWIKKDPRCRGHTAEELLKLVLKLGPTGGGAE